MFEELLALIKNKEINKAIGKLMDASPKSLLARDKNGLTILHHICKSEFLEIAKFVIVKVPEILTCQDRFNQETPLMVAIREGNIKLATYIISDFPSTIIQKDKDNRTILYKILQNKYLTTINLHVEKIERAKAEVYDGILTPWNSINAENELKEEYNRFVETILNKFPALATMQDKFGTSPAHLAALQGDNKTIQELYKANPKCLMILNSKQNTPMQCANLRENFHTVKLMQEIIDNDLIKIGEYKTVLGEIYDNREHA